MKDSLKSGICFGLTSGVITTMGLIVGLHAGTESRLAVIGGILTIAIADALSDSLGIHVSKEAEAESTSGQIWAATLSTFAAKFVFAGTFLVPAFLLPLSAAVIVSLVWGFTALTVLSFLIARSQGTSVMVTVSEHIAIGMAVIIATHLVGQWTAGMVG